MAPRQYIGGPVPRELKRRLQEAAQANGRSVHAEFRSRLEASFVRQDLLVEVLTLLRSIK